MKKASDARIVVLVAVAFGCLVAAYVFAFRAVREAQIREVPLAMKGAGR